MTDRRDAHGALPRTLLVTGGAGFIGSNFVHHILQNCSDVHVVVLDALTYAGNRDNLQAWESCPRFRFVHGDICDAGLVHQLMATVQAVVHMAAETHVDRSIEDGSRFIATNVAGTQNLLEAARHHNLQCFLHVSTDEVYGSIEQGAFREEDPLNPSSPYAASKAGSDLLALAHHTTFGTPVVVSRSTNNFGPYQYPEKVIPFFITQALDDRFLPLYGDGLNVRDWLFVQDHCEALTLLLKHAEPGQIYNIGSGFETTNLALTRQLLRILGRSEDLIRFSADRLGHDRRYALDTTRLRQLGWRPRHSFDEALEATVGWYQENAPWWKRIKERQDEYKRFLAASYQGLS